MTLKTQVLVVNPKKYKGGFYVNAQGDTFVQGSYRKIRTEPTVQQHLIAKARRLMVAGKHAGSKPIYNLWCGARQTDRACSLREYHRNK